MCELCNARLGHWEKYTIYKFENNKKKLIISFSKPIKENSIGVLHFIQIIFVNYIPLLDRIWLKLGSKYACERIQLI